MHLKLEETEGGLGTALYDIVGLLLNQLPHRTKSLDAHENVCKHSTMTHCR